MINIEDIIKYCTSEQVIEYAKYTADKIKHDEYTQSFPYSSYDGMQFEDENGDRYIELNITEYNNEIKFEIFIDDNFTGCNSIECKSIDEAINKWNELY